MHAGMGWRHACTDTGMFVCCKRDVITFIRGCSDLRKHTSLDTCVMYLDRDCFRSSWLWVRELSPRRAVEPRAAGARLWRADLTRHGDHGYDIELSSVHE